MLRDMISIVFLTDNFVLHAVAVAMEKISVANVLILAVLLSLGLGQVLHKIFRFLIKLS